MKIKSFKNWIVESAETRLAQLGILPKMSVNDWLKRLIETAHPRWSITEGIIARSQQLRIFVHTEHNDDGFEEFDDTIEVEVDRASNLKFLYWKTGKREVIKMQGFPTSSRRETAQWIFDKFEEFVNGLAIVKEGHETSDNLSRLHQLGLTPNYTIKQGLEMLIADRHPDWDLEFGSHSDQPPFSAILVISWAESSKPNETARQPLLWARINCGYSGDINKLDREMQVILYEQPGSSFEPSVIIDEASIRSGTLPDFVMAKQAVNALEKMINDNYGEVDESFNRLQQLNLAPTGNFFDLLAMLVEREHPDWYLITRSIGRQIYIIPDWKAPVEISFEVDHSPCGDELDPNEHYTSIQPIDEMHRLKLKGMELVSQRGHYSPWTEAKRTLAKIEEYVDRTELAAANQ